MINPYARSSDFDDDGIAEHLRRKYDQESVEIILYGLGGGSDAWTPFIKAVFDSIENIGKDDAGDCKDQHTDKHFICLKRCSRDRNHKTDTRRRCIEFAG